MDLRVDELSITCSLAAAWADRKAGLVAESGQSSSVHLYRNIENTERLLCTVYTCSVTVRINKGYCASCSVTIRIKKGY